MNPKELFKKIIFEQSQIIGSKLARARALDTGSVIFVSESDFDVEIRNHPQEALSKLINAYGEIFGEASVEVCIDVIKRFPINEIEQILPADIAEKVSRKRKQL